MDYSYNQNRKRVKPITGGETEDEYRKVMQNIIEGLTKENLETILFLCKDHIPHGRDIKSPLELFRYLEDKDLVSQDDAVFVAEVLHLVRRMDLLKVIPCIKNKRHFEDEYLACTYTHFSNYRVLTVHLQDELSQRDFETFRFKCATHLRIRSLENADSVLTLLKKLEEEDVISEDNFEELITILEGIENVRPLKMFRRLLDGDDSVVLPAGKQATPQTTPPQEGRTENASYLPSPQDSRVEMMPPGYHPQRPTTLPQGYANTRHAEPIEMDPRTAPKAWREKGDPVTYEFGHTGTFFSAAGRVFHSAESTPKMVGGGPANPYREYQDTPSRFQSMPANWHEQQNRPPSELSSLPLGRSPPPGYDMEYGQEFMNQQQNMMPHPATYPQNLSQIPHHAGHHHPFMQQGRQYAVHQGYGDSPYAGYHRDGPGPQYFSYAGQAGQRVHRNVSYPTMPFQSPPDRLPEDVVHLERRMKDVSISQEPLREEEVNEPLSMHHTNEKFVFEDDLPTQNPANKATRTKVTVEPLEAKVSKQEPSVEQTRQVEELQRRNEELERVLREQKTAGCYKMDSSPVGFCVLINNVRFKDNFNEEDYLRRLEANKTRQNDEKLVLPRTDLQDRKGSDQDAAKLEKLFKSFDFEVRRYDDLDQRAIKKVVKEYQMTDQWDYDCFMLIILSHGDLGKVYGVCGYSIPIADIQGAFCIDKCESLANKPKILIIQACQGSRVMHGHSPEADIATDGPKDGTTPNKADFLVAYSTVPGYQSYRSQVHGSHFITELVRIFKTHFNTQDLLSMMIMVNNEMCNYAHKQIPMPVPTLRKKVFFHLKDGWEEEVEEGVEEAAAGPSAGCTAVQVSHTSSSSASSANTSSSTPGTDRNVAFQSYASVFEDRGIGHQESGEQEDF